MQSWKFGDVALAFDWSVFFIRVFLGYSGDHACQDSQRGRGYTSGYRRSAEANSRGK